MYQAVLLSTLVNIPVSDMVLLSSEHCQDSRPATQTCPDVAQIFVRRYVEWKLSLARKGCAHGACSMVVPSAGRALARTALAAAQPCLCAGVE
jgi:hypothetical protein